jgi:hypothetical protein
MAEQFLGSNYNLAIKYQSAYPSQETFGHAPISVGELMLSEKPKGSLTGEEVKMDREYQPHVSKREARRQTNYSSFQSPVDGKPFQSPASTRNTRGVQAVSSVSSSSQQQSKRLTRVKGKPSQPETIDLLYDDDDDDAKVSALPHSNHLFARLIADMGMSKPPSAVEKSLVHFMKPLQRLYLGLLCYQDGQDCRPTMSIRSVYGRVKLGLAFQDSRCQAKSESIDVADITKC